MNLDELIIACFCLIDDQLPTLLKGKRWRSLGPMPELTDSEMLTIEVVGSYLGLNQDKMLYDSFCRHLG